MSDYSEDDDSPLIKKAKPTVRPQKVFAHYPIFADDDAIFATSRVAESICQNIRTSAAAAKAIDENFKRTERILIGGLASVNQIVENFRQNTSNITNLIRQYESPFGDFLKNLSTFNFEGSFTHSASEELIAQRFTSPSAATDRVIAAYRKTTQTELKIAIGATPSDPRKQKAIASPPQDAHPFIKLAYGEIIEFIGDEDMKNQFIAKMGHFDLNLNFWGSNKIKFYVKNRLIAYLAINCIKETSQLLLYEPTTAEDATAYLEGFQVIHRLQTHLYSTIGTAPPPARDHNLFWKPEPLPQPTQPEPVKPASAISQPSPQGSPVIIINAGDHATVNVGDSNIIAGSHAIAVDGNVGGDVTTGSEKNANKSHSKKAA